MSALKRVTSKFEQKKIVEKAEYGEGIVFVKSRR